MVQKCGVVLWVSGLLQLGCLVVVSMTISVVWNWMESKTCENKSWSIKLADTPKDVHTTLSLTSLWTCWGETRILSGWYCQQMCMIWTQCSSSQCTRVLWTQYTNVQGGCSLWKMLMTFTPETFLDCIVSPFLIGGQWIYWHGLCWNL